MTTPFEILPQKTKNKKGSWGLSGQEVKELPGDDDHCRWHTLKLRYFILFVIEEENNKIKCKGAVSNPEIT